MDPFEIFMLVWMFVLPMLAIIFGTLLFLGYFILMPSVSKRLMWARWRDKSIFVIGDDMGWADIVVADEELPEGVCSTKRAGYRFLPRPRTQSSSTDPRFRITEDMTETEVKALWERQLKEDQDLMDLESQYDPMILKKYMLRGLGKPMWFGYLGKVGVLNPQTLASISGIKVTGTNPHNPINFGAIKSWIQGLPKNVEKNEKTRILNMLEEAESYKHEVRKDLYICDPTEIKRVIPRKYTPSQIEAVGTNRELKGMKKMGKQMGQYIIFLGVIVVIVVIIIGILYLVTGGFKFGGGETTPKTSTTGLLWTYALSRLR